MLHNIWKLVCLTIASSPLPCKQKRLNDKIFCATKQKDRLSVPAKPAGSSPFSPALGQAAPLISKVSQRSDIKISSGIFLKLANSLFLWQCSFIVYVSYREDLLHIATALSLLCWLWKSSLNRYINILQRYLTWSIQEKCNIRIAHSAIIQERVDLHYFVRQGYSIVLAINFFQETSPFHSELTKQE